MGYDLLLEIIEYIGPFALFLVLCLGLIGLPIPNEAVALTGGALAETGIIHEALSYIMLSLGMCSAMSFNYSLGRFTNNKFTSSKFNQRLNKQHSVGKFMEKSQGLIDKYGLYAIPISVFFPFLRHATPYIMGVNRLKYLTFVLIGFPSAMLWAAIYFILGHFVGDQMPDIIKTIERYETVFFIAFAIVVVIALIYFVTKFKKKRSSADHRPS